MKSILGAFAFFAFITLGPGLLVAWLETWPTWIQALFGIAVVALFVKLIIWSFASAIRGSR